MKNICIYVYNSFKPYDVLKYDMFQAVDMRECPWNVPIYLTARATNAYETQALLHCSIPTIDGTPPTGRLEPWHLTTSHPKHLHANLLISDDSPLVLDQYMSIGKGIPSDSIVPWHMFDFSDDPRNSDAEGVMSKFASGKVGRLNVEPLNVFISPLDNDCADKCIEAGDPCVSFDYDYSSGTCNIHTVIEGIHAQLVTSGAYNHFERLGQGSSAYFTFDDLHLRHGSSYYFNVLVTNDKGYRSLISSDEIVVDFTPPEPGLIQNAKQDIFQHDGCEASVNHGERCENVTPLPNHRVIVDGPGSETVYNGNIMGTDLLYTINNHYISGILAMYEILTLYPLSPF